jgi:hypothetical protein
VDVLSGLRVIAEDVELLLVSDDEIVDEVDVVEDCFDEVVVVDLAADDDFVEVVDTGF